ncbi:response regulator [Patescibacteria group bacterium]|nr:response regulator [Patescibacteria group bacterium]
MMPVCDGFAVLERMKEYGYKVPVMVLTNLSQAEDEKRARDLGAKDFIIKSNTPIIDIIQKVKVFLKK